MCESISVRVCVCVCVCVCVAKATVCSRPQSYIHNIGSRQRPDPQ
ncbi:MAG: hypothetical protein ACRC4N_02430 [Gammaproteobacteria bacterium]